jgi:transcriptional regulator with XRE-family HTH domain
LNQESLAEAAKISQHTYSDIEGDRIASPRRPILKALAKMLDIPFESLLLGDDWRNEPPMSEADRVISREIPGLSPEARNKILVVILEDKQQRDATAPPQDQENTLKAA